MLTAMVLTAVIANGNLAANTVTIYYVLGILAALSGAIVGGYKLYQRQKVKWTEEGVTRARQAQAVQENSNKLSENTNAIVTLSTRMESWMAQVNSNLNGLGHRIDKLERFNAHSHSRLEDE
jgi:uncharacterized protein HemX